MNLRLLMEKENYLKTFPAFVTSKYHLFLIKFLLEGTAKSTEI